MIPKTNSTLFYANLYCVLHVCPFDKHVAIEFFNYLCYIF